MTQRVVLCDSSDLINSEQAVPFDVSYDVRNSAAFAIRYQDHVYAYLNLSLPE